MFLLSGKRIDSGGMRMALTKDLTRSVKMVAMLQLTVSYAPNSEYSEWQ